MYSYGFTKSSFDWRNLGSVSGGVVQDRFFKTDYEEGPLFSIKSFNDWLLATATRQRPGPTGIITGPDLLREYLPDTGDVYFTHGDLTLGNVLIAGDIGCRRVVGIVDWEQSGWYPEYWEYCKMMYGITYEHGFRKDGWIESIVEPVEEELLFAFAEYFLWRNP